MKPADESYVREVRYESLEFVSKVYMKYRF